MDAKPGPSESVSIGFPVKCVYKGGHTTLGNHGKHFRIEDGEIGYGEFSLSHSIPLDAVASVEVSEQEFGGSDAKTLVGFGSVNSRGGGFGGSPASEPKQVTLITVRTKDHQEPLWEVDHRGAEWVRERLTPALRQAGIPYYEDLSPSERAG
jgi:hypothetical protein